jgi:hypothetical protein
MLVKISRHGHRSSKFSTLVHPVPDTRTLTTKRKSVCKKSGYLNHVGNCQPKILLNFLSYLTTLIVIPNDIPSKVGGSHGGLI